MRVGEPIQLPRTDWTHVLDWWEQYGIGREMSWSELKSWSDLFQVDAQPHELEALMKMNNAYINQRHKTEVALSSPFDPRSLEEQRLATMRSIKASTARFKRAK